MAKYSSQTSYFQVLSAGSPGTWVTVGNVTNIRDLRSGTAAEEDVSDLASTAVEVMTHLPDNGSMSLDLIYDPSDTGQARLETLQSTVPIPMGHFRAVALPADKMFSFDGFVSTFPFTLAAATSMRGSVTIRISGAITATPVGSPPADPQYE